MNRLHTAKRVQVIAALVEGSSINSIVRMTGVAKHTILKLLEDMGCACAMYHHRNIRGLRVRRLQCDEIWAFVGAKAEKCQRRKEGWRGGVRFGRGLPIDADDKALRLIPGRRSDSGLG